MANMWWRFTCPACDTLLDVVREEGEMSVNRAAGVEPKVRYECTYDPQIPDDPKPWKLLRHSGGQTSTYARYTSAEDAVCEGQRLMRRNHDGQE